LGLGCQAVGPTTSKPTIAPRAERLWEQGQAALQEGQADQAISCFEQSLAEDDAFVRSHLSLAAARLEKGDVPRACGHLERYLAVDTQNLLVRLHYAELLWREKRLEPARAEFRRFAADAQGSRLPALGPLIHCHSRLMEIAEVAEDEYDEHLQRGIGLFLLSRDHPTDADEPTDPGNTECLLCKAACELTLARSLQPDRAQPSWYLYQVWSHLGQRQPAQKCLEQAREIAPFAVLTPHERTSLELASRNRDASSSRR
jgi:tetratricopeptide (TPR) repeat protein